MGADRTENNTMRAVAARIFFIFIVQYSNSSDLRKPSQILPYERQNKTKLVSEGIRQDDTLLAMRGLHSANPCRWAVHGLRVLGARGTTSTGSKGHLGEDFFREQR
jgi:hypothetical protein